MLCAVSGWTSPQGSVAQIRSGDSSRESSMVAGRHEQTYPPPDLQDQELASL